MAALEELAVFVLQYCDRCDPVRAADRRLGVAQILTSVEFPTDRDRHNVLYGFALSCGATRAADFDPTWVPGVGK